MSAILENKRASAVFEALFCLLNGLKFGSICCRLRSVGQSGDDATPIQRIDPCSTNSGCEVRDGVRIPTFELSAEYFAKCSVREIEGAFRGAWAMHLRLTEDPQVYGKSIRNGFPRGPGKGKSSAQHKDCRAAGVTLSGDRETGLRWTVKSASDDAKSAVEALRSWWDVSLGLKKDGTTISTDERDAKNAMRRAKRAAKLAEDAEMVERGEVRITILVHEDESDWLTTLIEQNDGDSVGVMKKIRAAVEMPVAEAPADEKAA